MEAAYFDLDKTVIAKASLVAFGRPLYDAGMISRLVVMRALWSNLLFHYLGADEERMRKFRSSALRMTRGWDQALVSSIVRDTLADVIEPIVYAEALDLIEEHHRAGRRVFLVSASPEEIVAPLAQFLGVDEAISSRAELDADGRYTGNVEFWSYGPYKAEAIRHSAERLGIDLDRSYAYSDSATDVPMLEAVGHPVAVNPDRDLARVARERGWETRWFEHGVPLRERMNVPRPAHPLRWAAAVALVALAGTALWWWFDQGLPGLPARLGAPDGRGPAPAGRGRRRTGTPPPPPAPPRGGRPGAWIRTGIDRIPLPEDGTRRAGTRAGQAVDLVGPVIGRLRTGRPPALLPPSAPERPRRSALAVGALPDWLVFTNPPRPPHERGGPRPDVATRPAASSPRRRRGRAERRSR
jgi:HAD superfamily hydrolase (TIGR01490 family)